MSNLPEICVYFGSVKTRRRSMDGKVIKFAALGRTPQKWKAASPVPPPPSSCGRLTRVEVAIWIWRAPAPVPAPGCACACACASHHDGIMLLLLLLLLLLHLLAALGSGRPGPTFSFLSAFFLSIARVPDHPKF